MVYTIATLAIQIFWPQLFSILVGKIFGPAKKYAKAKKAFLNFPQQNGNLRQQNGNLRLQNNFF